MAPYEMASTYTKLLIEALLNAHALTNMHRSSDKEEFRKSAADWLPRLDSLLNDLKRELTKESSHD